MRLFMLYSNQFAVGNKPIGIATLAAVLKRDGHDFHLFDCTRYRIQKESAGGNDSNLAGAKTLAFKHPVNEERLPSREPVTYTQLVRRLLDDIEQYKPDIIGLTALTDDYPLGLGMMREVRKAFPDIPVVAGGIHATVDPKGVIEEDCFDMVCVGEGEQVVLDLAERVDAKRDFEDIANLWVKRPDGSIQRNAVRPLLLNLDELPYPDWEIYGEEAFYKPFLGHVYKYGDFEMSRGCPYKCSYCINVQLQEIYKTVNSNSYHREKSIPRIIAEIKHMKDEYDIEFLKFWDETFLLMSPERQEEFNDLYASQVGLPYVIETTAQSITPYSAEVLRNTNCRSVSLGLETGSVDMRKGLLHKTTNNAVYVEAAALLKSKGVQCVTFNMIGLPNESQDDIFRTIAMNRLMQSDTQSVGVFYPYKGTPIRDMMVQNEWMDEDFEYQSLRDYDFNTFTAGNRSVVRFKDMDSIVINRLWMLFSSYVFWPIELHPLIDIVKNAPESDPFAVTLLDNIQAVTYFMKFDEWPPGWEAADTLRDQGGITELRTADGRRFAALLVGSWKGPNLESLMQAFRMIAAGEMASEISIPDDPDQLAVWLEPELSSENLRNIRVNLREMAQYASKSYEAGEIVSAVGN